MIYVLEQNDLKNINVEMKDGELSCAFQRPKNTDIDIPGGNNTLSFDMENHYYLLIAKGPLSNSLRNDLGFQLSYHPEKAISPTKVDFSEFGIVSSNDNFVKVMSTVKYLINLALPQFQNYSSRL